MFRFLLFFDAIDELVGRNQSSLALRQQTTLLAKLTKEEWKLLTQAYKEGRDSGKSLAELKAIR